MRAIIIDRKKITQGLEKKIMLKAEERALFVEPLCHIFSKLANDLGDQSMEKEHRERLETKYTWQYS